MQTYSQLVADIQACGDFRRAKPRFIEFSVKLALVVHNRMNSQAKKANHQFLDFKKIRNLPGFDSRMVYSDTPQFADFAGIVAEVTTLGVVSDGKGVWFFNLDREKSRKYTVPSDELTSMFSSAESLPVPYVDETDEDDTLDEEVVKYGGYERCNLL
jgi:hypothetical protein